MGAKHAPRSGAGLPASALEVVRRTLRSYADRGVFRSYSEAPTRRGRSGFRLGWLTDEPFDVIFDRSRAALIFKDILPEVPPGSKMDADLRAFLRERQQPELPGHRRVDPDRLRVTCYNRGGSISIRVALLSSRPTPEELEYGVRKAVNLVNEIFQGFLYRSPHSEYAAEHFAAAGE